MFEELQQDQNGGNIMNNETLVWNEDERQDFQMPALQAVWISF